MTDTVALSFADVERAVRDGRDDAIDVVTRFLRQPDKAPDPVPAGYIDTGELARRLQKARGKRTKRERSKASTEVWRAFLAQPAPLPERFKLADLIVDVYERGGDAGRETVRRIAKDVPWDHGVFGGLKRVLKIAEDRHDATTWAVISGAASNARGASSGATRSYLAARAWRFVRDLGRAVPELYPWWGAEILLHTANWSRASSRVQGTMSSARGHKALHEAWSLSPLPLTLIMQSAPNDGAVRAAWQALSKLHPQAAKAPSTTLVRALLSDQNSGRHEAFLELQKGAPTVTSAWLVEQGMGGAAASLLSSRSPKARTWAQTFVREQKTAVPPSRLIALASTSKEAGAVAVEVLSAMPARDLGPALLLAARAASPLRAMADKALVEQFTLAELGEAQLLELAFDDDNDGNELLEALDKKHRLPLSFWRAVVFDDRMADAFSLSGIVIGALKKLGTDAVPASFLLDALVKRHGILGSDIGSWLSEAKTYPGLDVERVKGLLFDNNLKDHALAILNNRTLIKPTSLGLPWLLALARRRDSELSSFAKRTLLEHLGPADFSTDGEAASGTARLFELALSPSEQPAMRAFAQTYLRCHHPDLSESQPESKQLGLKPQLKRTAYTAERLWGALRDEREDVRRFAVAVAKVELRRWGKTAAVAALADTDHQDVRRLALDALTRAGDPAADPACTCTVDELSADAVFPLTESKRRPVREAGLALIRTHYARLGGEQRLAWLMTSADREVRLFAARLLWDKHRPRSFPQTWKPKKSGLDPTVLDGTAGAPSDASALGAFLRRVLFSLPLGRSMEAKDDDGGAYRRLPTSIAKRRLIEVVRDLALEDAAFADAAVPVLQELSGSLAKGEWQSCVQALCAIDAARRTSPLSSTVAQAAE